MDSAAETIRDARRRARLTQTQLAARAGITQSVVSAYEARRRAPSVETLRHLVEAAGFELNLGVGAVSRPSSLLRSVEANRAELVARLAELGGRNVRLFGSVGRGEDGPESDIDLLVTLDDHVGLFGLADMRAEAERILGATVDLVPDNSLKPDVAQRILSEAVPV